MDDKELDEMEEHLLGKITIQDIKDRLLDFVGETNITQPFIKEIKPTKYQYRGFENNAIEIIFDFHNVIRPIADSRQKSLLIRKDKSKHLFFDFIEWLIGATESDIRILSYSTGRWSLIETFEKDWNASTLSDIRILLFKLPDIKLSKVIPKSSKTKYQTLYRKELNDKLGFLSDTKISFSKFTDKSFILKVTFNKDETDKNLVKFRRVFIKCIGQWNYELHSKHNGFSDVNNTIEFSRSGRDNNRIYSIGYYVGRKAKWKYYNTLWSNFNLGNPVLEFDFVIKKNTKPKKKK